MSDKEMVALLYDISRMFERDKQIEMQEKILKAADRLKELTEIAETRKHWTGHE